MQIRVATHNDLPAIMEIVAGVVAEMEQLENPQWNLSYPVQLSFQTDIEARSLYLATRTEEESSPILGFCTIDSVDTAEYASLAWQFTEPMFVHRLAVHPTGRYLGTASALENYACSLARSNGSSSLRVDTHSCNMGMQAFLAKRDYHKVGEVFFPPRPLPFFCYEKQL